MIAKFYFSLRSPYSWIGYRDLLDVYPDVAAAVQWLPFWEPEPDLLHRLQAAGDSFPYVDMSRAKALYILQDVRRLARRRDLDMVWPVDRSPRWEVAHLAYLAAVRLDAGPAFIDAAYRARWESGRDISDPAVIGEIAVELGLDPAPLVKAADDPGLREEGLTALRAVARDGVFGVPFFVCGREKFWGVDRLADFAAAVRRNTSGSQEVASWQVAPAGPGVDQGHAGGCG